MRNLFILLVFLSFLSCQQKTENAVDQTAATSADSSKVTKSKKFDMYEMSELALLMEQMYIDNQRLKDKIVANDSLGSFPEHFRNIHESAFTDPTEKDAFFKEQAALFLAAQEKIYQDPDNAKAHFNQAVNVCIECHQVKCSGPIPKIKKLLIQ